MAAMTVATLKLYELADHYAGIMDALIEAGGELTPELTTALDAVDEAYAVKAEAVALYIRNLEVSAGAVEAEADRLRTLAVQRTNSARSLKGYLMLQMQRMGQDKVETYRVRLRIQKNARPAIAWTLTSLPPEDYVRVKHEVDLQKAYEIWKAGTELPSGFTVTQGSHLRLT